jgi:hypothetical protein
VAGCCEYSKVTQGLGLGWILLNGVQDTVEWQAVVSTVKLHGALDLVGFS